MNKNTGGTAFPLPIPWCKEGMTLRDYFAAKAMQGFLADNGLIHDYAQFADTCYQMADAMLKAREK